MQKIIKIIIIFIFIFVIGIFYISLTRDTNYNTSSLINKETPEFKIISFDDLNYYTKDNFIDFENNSMLLNTLNLSSEIVAPDTTGPVSYTHLTLPTK